MQRAINYNRYIMNELSLETNWCIFFIYNVLRLIREEFTNALVHYSLFRHMQGNNVLYVCARSHISNKQVHYILIRMYRIGEPVQRPPDMC